MRVATVHGARSRSTCIQTAMQQIARFAFRFVRLQFDTAAALLTAIAINPGFQSGKGEE
jgi:hypothetical protein